MLVKEHLCVCLLVQSYSKSCSVVDYHILISRVLQILSTVKSSIPKSSFDLDVLIRRSRHGFVVLEPWRREDLALPGVNCKSLVSLINFFLLEHADSINLVLDILICVVVVLLSLSLDLFAFFLIVDEFPLEGSEVTSSSWDQVRRFLVESHLGDMSWMSIVLLEVRLLLRTWVSEQLYKSKVISSRLHFHVRMSIQRINVRSICAWRPDSLLMPAESCGVCEPDFILVVWGSWTDVLGAVDGEEEDFISLTDWFDDCAVHGEIDVQDCWGVAFEFSERFEVLISTVEENHLVVSSNCKDWGIFVKLNFRNSQFSISSHTFNCKAGSIKNSHLSILIPDCKESSIGRELKAVCRTIQSGEFHLSSWLYVPNCKHVFLPDCVELSLKRVVGKTPELTLGVASQMNLRLFVCKLYDFSTSCSNKNLIPSIILTYWNCLWTIAVDSLILQIDNFLLLKLICPNNDQSIPSPRYESRLCLSCIESITRAFMGLSLTWDGVSFPF